MGADFACVRAHSELGGMAWAGLRAKKAALKLWQQLGVSYLF